MPILRFDSIINIMISTTPQIKSPFQLSWDAGSEERQVNLVDDISFFADGLAMDISNAGETMFPIVVSIDISDDAYVDDFQEEAADQLIEELEKVVVKEADYYEQCPICLDKPSTGEEITYMPCSHFCHSNCLLKWFQKNASCPLCRFQC
uniref:E3 ubiquitin-protein ligase RNF181-like n=1 Tax=Nicotiana sylvestris TaxID=4096 RepID=A0A1U7YDW6_NICSY|nr:PREDICTED: E3 ubiquitin-protein ligase RNF181-like [Nicotiana sylvestris]